MDKVSYKFSSDFKELSEEDFIKEMRKRFKVKVKEAKEAYNELHGNSTGSPKKDKPVDKKGEVGGVGVPRAEKTESGTDKAPEGETEQGA